MKSLALSALMSACLVAWPAAAQPSFGGYACTRDCSGHEAGYRWAEMNGIDDPWLCSGNSQSFIEGCQAYVEEAEDFGESLTPELREKERQLRADAEKNRR